MTTPTTSIQTVIINSLPSISGSKVTYNSSKNIFLTEGHTSAAGNTYYQGIRLSDRLVINYDLGQGYAYTFLNGLKLYCFDNREKKLIGSQSYSCCVFSEQFAKEEAIRMLKDYLKSQAILQDARVEERMLTDFSEKLVAEATHKRTRLLM